MGGKLKQFICVLAVALCGHAQILSVPFTTSIAGGGEPVTVQFSCTTTITAGTGAGATNATNNIDCDTGGIGGIAANIFVAGNSACTNGALGGACSGPSAPTVTDSIVTPTAYSAPASSPTSFGTVAASQIYYRASGSFAGAASMIFGSAACWFCVMAAQGFNISPGTPAIDGTPVGATTASFPLSISSGTPAKIGELVVLSVTFDNVTTAVTLTTPSGYTCVGASFAAGQNLGGYECYKIKTDALVESLSLAASGATGGSAVIALFGN